MSTLKVVDFMIDRMLATIERANLQPVESRARRRRLFDTELHDDTAEVREAKRRNQWSVIGDYLRRDPVQTALLGEAINEHRFNAAIIAARVAGDQETADRLSEIAQREYIGACIQREWDKEDGHAD